MATLTILHTCDFHGRLSSERAREIARLRQERTPCLLFDCGDALRVGNLNPGWGRGQTLQRMNAAGYDAMAMGNRETHLWWGAVRRKLEGIHFPVLSSNVQQPRPPVKPWTIINSPSGARIGVFALTPPMVLSGAPAAHVCTVIFDDPIQMARKVALRLRPEVDLLIALSHLGRESDRGLVEAAPGIDLLLGGHDHRPGLPNGERAGNTFVARSSPYGKDLGEVVITLDRGKAIQYAARLLELPA